VLNDKRRNSTKRQSAQVKNTRLLVASYSQARRFHHEITTRPSIVLPYQML